MLSFLGLCSYLRLVGLGFRRCFFFALDLDSETLTVFGVVFRMSAMSLGSKPEALSNSIASVCFNSRVDRNAISRNI
jgi:hypothetical protein